MEGSEAHLVRIRVWMPDRPGALGAVASRIGGVKGDVIGIEILEHGAGRAIDDLVVALPEPGLVDLLVAEVSEVDGVDVEEVVPVPDEHIDPDLAALEGAAALVAATGSIDLVGELCALVHRCGRATWTCVIDLRTAEIRASAGAVPGPDWLWAFVQGSRSSELVRDGRAGPDDVLWAPMGEGGAVVTARDGHPFRARERRRLAAVAAIVAAQQPQIVE